MTTVTRADYKAAAAIRDATVEAIAKVRELATAQTREQTVTYLYTNAKRLLTGKPPGETLLKVISDLAALHPPDPAVCPVHDNLEHGKEAELLRSGIEALIKDSYSSVLRRDLENLLDSTAATDSEAYVQRKEATEQEATDAKNLAAFRAHPHADYAALSFKKSMNDGFAAPELREALTLAEKVLFPEGIP